MSMAVSSVPYSSPVYRSPMEDLYPKEILDAIGSAEVVEKLEPIIEKPNFAQYINKWRTGIPEGPAIKRGCDKEGRPFLEVYLPGYLPLIYYTYHNCKKISDFTKIENWQVGFDNREGCTIAFLGTSTHFSAAILMLSQIVKGEDWEESRRKLQIS